MISADDQWNWEGYVLKSRGAWSASGFHVYEGFSFLTQQTHHLDAIHL